MIKLTNKNLIGNADPIKEIYSCHKYKIITPQNELCKLPTLHWFCHNSTTAKCLNIRVYPIHNMLTNFTLFSNTNTIHTIYSRILFTKKYGS